MKSYGIQIHELIREAQRQNKFVGRFGSSDLGMSGAPIAVQLGRHGELSPGELSERLGLDPSTLSRSLDRLRRMGFVTSSRSDQDKRRKAISLTTSGKRELAKIDAEQNSRLEIFCSRISQSELFQLKNFFIALCDGCSAPASPVRPGEHHLREEFRRIAWIAEVVNDRIMGSELDSTQWQILSEVERGQGRATPTQIADRLSLPRNTLSQMLAALTLAGYVLRKKDKTDKRVVHLSLSSAGKAQLLKIEQTAAKKYERAIKDLEPDSIRLCLKIFEKFLGLDLAGEQKEIISPRIYIEKISDQTSLLEARRYLVLELVRQNLLEDIPEQLLPESDVSIVLRNEQQIAGLFSVRKDTGKLKALLCSPGLVDEQMFQQFFDACLARTDIQKDQLDTQTALVSNYLSGGLARLVRGL